MSRPDATPPDMQRLREAALQWLVRRQDAGWTHEAESTFQAWLAQDPQHGLCYAQCAQRWQEMDAMPVDLVQGMRQRLAADKARHAAPAPARRKFLLWPAASALASVAAAGVGLVAWQHWQAQPLSVYAFRTERGRMQNVTLGDGSILGMDTDTQLEVRFYRQRREVQLLQGQAMFEVTHDGRPFHVLAGPTRVTVVGTRFAVRYTPHMEGQEGVQVAVEEGRVRVAVLDAAQQLSGDYDLQQGVLLTAGRSLGTDASGQPGPTAAVAIEHIALWRRQRVSFLDAPLSQVVAELERYGPTGLRIHQPQVAMLRLSGTFDPLAVGALYQALPRALPVRLQADGDGFEIVLQK